MRSAWVIEDTCRIPSESIGGQATFVLGPSAESSPAGRLPPQGGRRAGLLQGQRRGGRLPRRGRGLPGPRHYHPDSHSLARSRFGSGGQGSRNRRIGAPGRTRMPRRKTLVTVIREMVQQQVRDAFQTLLRSTGMKKKPANGRRRRRRRRGPGRPPGSKTRIRRGTGRPPKTEQSGPQTGMRKRRGRRRPGRAPNQAKAE